MLLLVHARSAEGSRVAVGLLQVGQGLLVQLHGIPGEPAFQLATPPVKPDQSHGSGTTLKSTDEPPAAPSHGDALGCR